MTDNSKIEDEFEQNKLSKVCIVEFIVRIHPLFWNFSVKFGSHICHENINKPLDGAYLADFGIDIRPVISSLCTVQNSLHSFFQLNK